MPDRTHIGGGAASQELDRILAGGLSTVYQPIFEISSRALIGYEALARGPEGSPYESPEALFELAREADRTEELDIACQLLAIDTAIEAGVRPPLSLFLNGELSRARKPDPPPEEAGAFIRALEMGLPIVFEQTERGLIDDPAALILSVDRARRAGWRVALDDVGADPRALALMAVADPDIIKIDMNLLHGDLDTYAAEVASAIAAEAERSAPLVIAEGVERGEQLERAQALGATHVQGHLFGHPAPLQDDQDAELSSAGDYEITDYNAEDPFDVLDGSSPSQISPESLVRAMSRQLEAQAASLGETGLIVASFQTVDRFTGESSRIYADLAEKVGFVGVVAEGMPPEPAPSVRGGDAATRPLLREQWCVALLAPHIAGAFCARELDAEGRGGERRFEVAISQNRALVARVARCLLREVAPLES